jgi:hypothetical protein
MIVSHFEQHLYLMLLLLPEMIGMRGEFREQISICLSAQVRHRIGSSVPGDDYAEKKGGGILASA